MAELPNMKINRVKFLFFSILSKLKTLVKRWFLKILNASKLILLGRLALDHISQDKKIYFKETTFLSFVVYIVVEI